MINNINKIITNMSTFKTDVELKNYKNWYEGLKNKINYCCDVWNNIAYAWRKVNDTNGVDFDSRFYYQSIIFNLFMLGAITKSIEYDILENDKNLKDLRNNIAHMDEKLEKPLNFIPINNIYPNAIEENGSGGVNVCVSLIGLTIDISDPKTWIASSPLGIIGDTVFSSLQPTENRSKYKEFVTYKVTEENLNIIQNKLLNLLSNYFKDIKLQNKEEGSPLTSFIKE